MLNLQTCHLLKCPNGRFTYVGAVPDCLCENRPATTADIMAMRTHTGPDGKEYYAKPRVFDSEHEARVFAVESGIILDS